MARRAFLLLSLRSFATERAGSFSVGAPAPRGNSSTGAGAHARARRNRACEEEDRRRAWPSANLSLMPNPKSRVLRQNREFQRGQTPRL